MKSRKKTPTHPADGLYYLDAEMLARGDACRTGIRAFEAVAGGTSAPLTLQLVIEVQSLCSCIAWAASVMGEGRKVTTGEYWQFSSEYRGARSTRAAARAFMDLLLARAKREGLVRE